MAGYKGKTQTISSVSDILGFILEQSEKPPEKRRPVRPPQTAKSQAESEYVQTLVDALALPGTFAGDEYLKTMQSLVDPEIKIGSQVNRVPKVKLMASDLPEFFKNPDAFIDKKFKAMRDLSKAARLQWAGEQMRMLAGSTYAKKMGLFKGYGDLKPMLERAMGQSSQDSANPRDQQWIARASEELRQKGFTSAEIRKLQLEINASRDPERRKRLEKKLDRIGGLKHLQELERQLSNLDKKSNTSDWKELKGRIEGITKGLSSTESFRSLLGLEFKGREDKILRGRKKSELTRVEFEELNKTQSANNMLGLWRSYSAFETRDINGIKVKLHNARKHIQTTKKGLNEQIQAIKDGIPWDIGNGRTVDYSRLSKSQRSAEISVARKGIRQLNSAGRSLNSVRLWSSVGKLEGIYHGIKATFGSGGFEKILNREFFDPKYDYFGCPSRLDNLDLSRDKDQKWNSVEFVKSKSVDIRGKKNLVENYNEIMVQLYYLNPVTWVKSLVTGEGFAWIADKKRAELLKVWSVKTGVFEGLQDRKFWQFYKKWKGADPNTQGVLLAENSKYKRLMKQFVEFGLKDKNSNFAKKFLKAERIAEKLEKFADIAKFFGTPARLLNWFNEKTLGKLQETVRNGVFKVLSKLKVFTQDKAAMAFLESWKLTGGAALTSAISQAIIGALGLASSSVAGPVGFALTIVISEILEKVTKVTIKVLIFAIVGIFGFIILVTPTATGNLQAQTDGYSREIPGSINYNTGFGGYGDSGSLGGGGGGGLDIDVPAPTNSTCPLGDAAYVCTQGFTNTTCTHKNIKDRKPVDLALISYFYAPQYCDTSNCTATSNIDPGRCSDGNYTGQKTTFDDGQGNVFNLMHTKLIPPSNGHTYKGGEPVVYIYQLPSELVADDPQQITTLNPEAGEATDFFCWTGAHLHLTIIHNGQYIDPILFLVNMGCVNGPQSEADCPPCVGISSK